MLVIAAATLAQTVVSMGNSTLPMIAPRLAHSLGIDTAWIGMQVSIVFACGAACALFAGGLVRRLGACRSMQLALVSAAAGAALAAIPSVAAIAVGSSLIGIANGLAHPPAVQLMARFSPPSQLNLIFSIKQTGVPLGITLSALTAPAIAESLGWQWALLPVVALALGLAAGLQTRRATWDGDRVASAPLFESPLAALAAIWGLPQLRYLALAGAAFAAIQVSLSTFTVAMLVGEIGHGLIQAGLLMSLVTIAGVSARLVFGWVADRLQAGRLLLVAMGAGMIACCLLLGVLDSAWPPVAVTALFIGLGIAVIGWNGILHAEVAAASPPGSIGLIASAVSFFIFTSVALTPTLAVFIYRLLGSYSAMFAVISTFAVLGLVLLYASIRARHNVETPYIL